MEGSRSEGERQRLAALAAATANGLLVIFVLAVALPLLPPKLADPFWLLEAQAELEGLHLVSLDPALASFPCRLLW